MSAARLLLSGFILPILAASAWAQTPGVADPPFPGTDLLRDDDGSEPDTTAPWRYFPLAVGNAWEYYNYFTGERRRVDVFDTETHNGRTYFSTASIIYDERGEGLRTTFTRGFRYDTTAAAVWFYVPETGGEFPLFEASCPLDAPFGGELNCYLEGGPWVVGGGYDGLLAFGELFPGTGEDTVRTAVKTYVYDTNPGVYYDLRYAADLGLVYYNDEYIREGIYYARVDGVEHGVSVLPPFMVDAEAASPEPMGGLALEVYPNPFHASLSVEVERSEAGAVTVEVVDVLGRVVQEKELGWAGAGHEVIRVDTRDLRAGAYLIRVRSESGASVTRKVTKL